VATALSSSWLGSTRVLPRKSELLETYDSALASPMKGKMTSNIRPSRARLVENETIMDPPTRMAVQEKEAGIEDIIEGLESFVRSH
jgi:hypothetical protein